MNKQEIFLKEIVFKHLPEFVDVNVQEIFLQLLKQYPKAIDVENLIEHTLAKLGGYNFIDEEGRDFDDIDNSDSKTVTINENTGKAEVGGVENKIGSIRLTLYNTKYKSYLPWDKQIFYMYIPQDKLPILWNKCYGKQSHKKRLTITYSEKITKHSGMYISFNMYEPFLINTFEELATMTDAKFYQLNPNL